MTPPIAITRRLPALAVLLGLGGLIPFLACGFGAVWLRDEVQATELLAALIAYGAVILSFLGAVHWGLALEDQIGIADRARLLLGVLPALIGWAALVALFVQVPMASLAILAMGFLVVMAVEHRAAQRGLMPRGYAALRWLLTTIVVLDLAAVLVIRLVGLHLRS